MNERREMVSFPQGVINIYGENVINPVTDVETIEERIGKINSPQNLRDIIEGQNGASQVLTSKEYVDGTKLSLVLPTGPYTERSTMIGAYNEKIGSEGETQFIYDYPTDAQHDYWKLVVAGLLAENEILQEEGRSDVVRVWAENTMRVTGTTQSKRTSRTVRFPHGQFLELDKANVHPTTTVLRHVEEEQDVLDRGYFVDRFGKRLFERIESDTSEQEETFQVRRMAPFGYQVSFPFDDSDANIETIGEFMAEHHMGYKKTAEYYLDIARNHRFDRNEVPDFDEKLELLKEQPSYRTYFVANERNLDVIISPMFWSHGGIMESMGIRLDRSPDHEKKLTEEERLRHGQNLASKITREMGRAD